MTDRASWNMARISSRRPLPRELKLHPTTVGPQHRRNVLDCEASKCFECGYHVCSCKPQPVSKARAVGQHHCCGEYVCRCAWDNISIAGMIEQHNARQERARAEDARRMRGFGSAADWPDYGTTEGI